MASLGLSPTEVRDLRLPVELSRGPQLGGNLFYTLLNGEVRIARSLRRLISSLASTPRVHEERLASLTTRMAASDLTLTQFEGVYRVPPYQRARLAFGQRSTESLVRELTPLPPMSFEDAARELSAVVRSSIRRLITGKSRVAVMAGGGVDSSGVLACAIAEARGASGPEIEAIAIDFASTGDDRPYMRDLESALGIVPVRVKPACGAPHARRTLVLDATPVPVADTSYTLELLRGAKERGAELVLTGNAGDALFDGDPSVLGQTANSLTAVVRAVRDVYGIRTPWTRTPLQRVLQYVVRPVVKRALPLPLVRLRRHLRAAHVREWPWAGPELKKFLQQNASRTTRQATAVTPSERLREFRTSYFRADILDLFGSFELESGVEVRDPFLEEDVVELVMRLPPEMLFQGGWLRSLYRESIRGLVPDRVRLRRDKAHHEGALCEMVEAAGGFETFADLARVPKLEARGLVDAAKFRVALDALARDPAHTPWTEWIALSVESFLQTGADMPVT